MEWNRMSKNAEEQATEIIVALIGSEKAMAYLAGTAEATANNLTVIWNQLFATIRDAE